MTDFTNKINQIYIYQVMLSLLTFLRQGTPISIVEKYDTVQKTTKLKDHFSISNNLLPFKRFPFLLGFEEERLNPIFQKERKQLGLQKDLKKYL